MSYCEHCPCHRDDHDELHACTYCGHRDDHDELHACTYCGHTNSLFSKVYYPQELSGVVDMEKVTPPTDRATRKETPIYSGFIKYFPLAMVAVSQLSKSANEVHNPGQPLHWSKDKSNDHRDCIGRHLLELDEYDVEADFDYHYLHAVKNAWRSMAVLQEILERGIPARIKKGEL